MFTKLLEKLFNLDESEKSARELYVNTNKISEKDFNKLLESDPSSTKKYIDWMCKQLVEGYAIDQIIVLVEDFDKLSNKNLIANKDIYTYDYESATNEVEKYRKKKTKSEIRKFEKKDADIIQDDENFFIVVPKTKEAAILYGKGTKWCISAKESNVFNSYDNKDAKFYFIINKKTNKKFAVVAYSNGAIEMHDEKNVIISSIKKLDLDMFRPYTEKEKIIRKKERKEKIMRNILSRATQNPDGSYDVEGDVVLSGKKLLEFPIKFGHISGNFDCSWNKLTSLKGGPEKVEGDFDCSHNKLTSLEGAPGEVIGNFDCSWNKLVSLEGGPEKVGKSFYCTSNEIAFLEGAPKEVEGDFDCSNNQLVSLKGAPEKIKGNFWYTYPFGPKEELKQTVNRTYL